METRKVTITIDVFTKWPEADIIEAAENLGFDISIDGRPVVDVEGLPEE